MRHTRMRLVGVGGGQSAGRAGASPSAPPHPPLPAPHGRPRGPALARQTPSALRPLLRQYAGIATLICAASGRPSQPGPPASADDRPGRQGRGGPPPAAHAAEEDAPDDEAADPDSPPDPSAPTELVICFERQGEGWAEEIFPRVSLQRRAIGPARGRRPGRGNRDPGLAPRGEAAGAGASSTASDSEAEEEDVDDDSDDGAPPTTTDTRKAPRPNRAAHRLRGRPWEAGSLEAFLSSPQVGLSRPEVEAVIRKATAWRVTPGGRPLVDRSLRGRAERGAPGVASYLLSPEVGAAPGRAGVGAAFLAAPHILLTRPARHDRWDRRFVQLAVFIAEAGHAHVPDTAPAGLGAWAARQRTAWQAGALDEARSEALAASGFDFGEVALLTDAWEARFDQLVELRLTAAAAAASPGASRSSAALAAALPGGSAGDWLGAGWGPRCGSLGRALAVWCALQRALRRRGLLPDCVAARLDAVGFDWAADEEPGGSSGGADLSARSTLNPATATDKAFMASLGDLARQVERARGAAARAAAARAGTPAAVEAVVAKAAKAAAAAAHAAAEAQAAAQTASHHHQGPAPPPAGAATAAPSLHRRFPAVALAGLWGGFRPSSAAAAALLPPRPPPTPPPMLTPGEIALQSEPSQRRAAFAAAFLRREMVGIGASRPSKGAKAAAAAEAAEGVAPPPPAKAPPLDAPARSFALRAAATWLAGRLPPERAALLRVAGWDPEFLILPPAARGGTEEGPAEGQADDGWLVLAAAVADRAAAAEADHAVRLRLGSLEEEEKDEEEEDVGAAAPPARTPPPRLIARWVRAQRALAGEGALAPGRAAALASRGLEWVLAPKVKAAAATAATPSPASPHVPVPRPVSRARQRAAAALGEAADAAAAEEAEAAAGVGRPRRAQHRLTAGVR